MSYVGGPIAWRLPISIQALFGIGVIILTLALPESPRWLLNHGREEEAMEVLCLVYDKDSSDPSIVAEQTAIKQAIELEDVELQQNRSILSIFRRDKVRTGYRVFLAWFLQFMNQASGINLVVYYIPTVLNNSVGLTGRTSSILGGFIMMMFVVGGIWPSLALDRMGRRKTMMVSDHASRSIMVRLTSLIRRDVVCLESPCSASLVCFRRRTRRQRPAMNLP